MPDPLPSAQDVAAQILAEQIPLAGDPPPPSAPPPPAVDTPPVTTPGAGFRLAEPAPAPPAAPPVDEAATLRAQLAAREQELALERQRAQLAQQTAASAASTAAAVEAGMLRARQQEAALYEQARLAQPPQPDPDADWSDPKVQHAHALRVQQWGEARMMAMLQPYAQALQALQGNSQTQEQVVRRSAKNEAAALAKQRGATDFDELWPTIEERLSSAPQLFADPQNLVNAYALIKIERNQTPFQATKTPPTPPSADPRPGIASPDVRAVVARHAPMANHIDKILGLEGDLAVTAADLHRVGLLAGTTGGTV